MPARGCFLRSLSASRFCPLRGVVVLPPMKSIWTALGLADSKVVCLMLCIQEHVWDVAAEVKTEWMAPFFARRTARQVDGLVVMSKSLILLGYGSAEMGP